MRAIAAFYKFSPIAQDSIETVAARLRALAGDVRGLVILAPEGVNATLSGEELELERFLSEAAPLFGVNGFDVKFSSASEDPFRKFVVKCRPELVTSGHAKRVDEGINSLTPSEWHLALSEPGAYVLDTRNDYECRIGKFQGAIDPEIKSFTELPHYLEQNPPPKDAKVLVYCTGGIRCEKVLADMKERGYDNIFQLRGGILNYLKEFPSGKFNGECFVFDDRVAVDSSLKPTTRYKFCASCGNPTDHLSRCLSCENEVSHCVGCTPGFCKDCAGLASSAS